MGSSLVSNKETFNGTGLVIWYSDGKLKYKCMSDQDMLKKEVERIRATVPDRAVAVLAVNWDADEILAFVGENPEGEYLS